MNSITSVPSDYLSNTLDSDLSINPMLLPLLAQGGKDLTESGIDSDFLSRMQSAFGESLNLDVALSLPVASTRRNLRGVPQIPTGLSQDINSPLENLEIQSIDQNIPSELGLVSATQVNPINLLTLRNSALSKLSWDLSTLFSGINPFASTNSNSPFTFNSYLQVIGNSVAIEAVADTDANQLLSDLQALGLQHSSSFGRVISGLISVSALDEVASLSSLRFARPVYKPFTNVGSVNSQGDIAQRSSNARSIYGINGAGVTIGVLSDSYNFLGGANNDILSGDLPSGVIVLQDYLQSGASDEGRAMLQIVYDVAPGATLAFNTAYVGGQSGFANGILNLAKSVASGGAGAKVIVDDVGYFAEPFFQDGIVTQAVNQVTSNGVAYFSAAGNSARQSYESVFRPGIMSGGYTFHDFDPTGTVNIFQQITINGEFIPSLQWDQPFASAGGAGSQNDLDIFLFSTPSLSGNPITGSANDNINGDAVEVFGFSQPGTYYLAIGKYNAAGGPDPGLIKYIDFGYNNTYQFATNSSTSVGHNQAANGLGVAAAYYRQTPAYGVNPPLPESFTSLGGTPILFDTAGNRLATPIDRRQPAITAPDGGDTTFFGSDRDGNGRPNFSGTSAAAPHAAAVAALIRQAIPNVTNTQIYNALKNTAIDMNTAGYDYLTGNGLIQADAAIAALTSTITLSVLPSSVTEDGANNLVYTFTRTNHLIDSPLTVSFSVGGSATFSNDYSQSGAASFGANGTVTFAAGSLTAQIIVDPQTDTNIEPDETVALTLTSGAGYTVGTPNSATGTILNDDFPVITLSVAPSSVNEDGTGELVYTFTRNSTLGALNVNYTVSGTATPGSDYSALSGTVNFTDGSNTATVTVNPTDDTTIESDETLVLTVASGAGYTVGTPNSATGTILNDDFPVITLSVAPSSVNEDGTGELVYTFTRNSTLGALNVNYTVSGTATPGSDYSPLSGSVNFANGSNTATVTVNPTDDTTIESDETLILAVNSGSGYTVGTPNSATGTILNDDFPVITLSVAPSSVSEDGTTNLVYTFTRSDTNGGALTVNFNVSGTATLNTDYTESGADNFLNSTSITNVVPAFSSITFAAGAATAQIIVDPIADTDVEADETVALTLASGVDYIVGTPNSATGTILNDDTLPSVSVSVAPASVSEDGTGALVYTFTRSDTSGPLTVNYGVSGTATPGSDYSPLSGSVNFANGSNTATVTVNPTDDTLIEPDETLILAVNSGSGYTVGTPNSATGTILNDDFPVITLSVAPSSVSEDGTTNLVYTFTRSDTNGGALTVNFNVGGSATFSNDYTQSGANTFNGTNGTITFTAGAATAQMIVDPTADSQVEFNETVGLTLTSGIGYKVGTTTAVTGTILNDDVPIMSIEDASITEGNTGSKLVSLSVRLSTPSVNIVTVNYATADGSDPNKAIAGSDYTTTNGILTFYPGTTLLNINVPILGDTTVESDEHFSVNLTSVNGAILGNSQGKVTILDDDSSSSITFTGTNGNDVFTGGDGNDTINGLDGNDILDGAAGDDVITGGLGKDVITGGFGADTLVYPNFTHSLFASADRLRSFNAGEGDRIDLASIPTATFNAGIIDAADLTAAVNAAYADPTTAGTQALAANQAVFFSFGPTPSARRIYLSVNDSTSSFNASSDFFIEVTGIVGTLPLGSLTSSNYFS